MNDEKISGAKAYEASMHVYTILLELGIPANLKGFRYLHTAICRVYEDAAMLDAGMYRLYGRIAAENHTTAASVERLIRVAAARAEEAGDRAFIIRCFGQDKCPPAKEFIADVADLLHRDMEGTQHHEAGQP